MDLFVPKELYSNCIGVCSTNITIKGVSDGSSFENKNRINS